MFIADIRTDTELADEARLFFGDENHCISLAVDGRNFCVNIDGNDYIFDYSDDAHDIIPQAHLTPRLSKIALYDALSAHTRREMPWGALTGVRPTKLFYECLTRGKSHDQAVATMQSVYRVSDVRADILSRIVRAQSGKVTFPSEYVNLYVHVPYCTSRCSYCSFVSLIIGKNAEQSQKYTELLCDEIKRSTEFLRGQGKKILSVYIGGGTPTALDDNAFEKMLDSIGDVGCEYSCEAGRPDTITERKADIMKAHGVTRVCVNPQTLNDKTLEAIGRMHSAADFFAAYDMIARRGFDINCDLIAGLESETVADFTASFEGIKRLMPQNITVHSLSKKNGSAIRYESGENENASAMTDYALSHLGEYRPYYLYRQKRQVCNLENIGFSLVGSECVNNITTMEETASVMACGAGAISKVIAGGKITRFANMRDVKLYIDRYEEKLVAKLECFYNAE